MAALRASDGRKVAYDALPKAGRAVPSDTAAALRGVRGELARLAAFLDA